MGDEVEAIERFCREVSPRLVGALTLQCGSKEAAEDLAQEAMAKVWERWNELRLSENPSGWAYRVAFNLALSAGRRRAAERRALERMLVDEPDGTDDATRMALRDALAELAPRQRAAVVLRFYGQFSVAETAEAMGCATGTVKALTSQGIARLRLIIEFTTEGEEAEHGRAF